MINRPVPVHTREFRIEQADKKESFVEKFIEMEDENDVKTRVFKLVENFLKQEKTVSNVLEYQSLDRIITKDIVAATKQTGWCKFGYMGAQSWWKREG